MHSPRHLPLMRAVLPLIAGILICSYFPRSVSAPAAAACFIAGGIILLLLKNKQYIFTPVLLLIFTAFGYLYAQIHIPKFHSNAFQNTADAEDTLLLKINSPVEEKPNSYKTTAEILIHSKSGEKRHVKGNLLLYFSNETQPPNYGDNVAVTAHVNEIEAPKNPGDFNFKKFMAGKHIYHSAYVAKEKFKITSAATGFSLFRKAHKTRKHLLYILSQAFDQHDDFAVASALILGYKNDLSPEIKHAYSSAGAMHILAVSGLHVGIVYLMIMFFLKPLPHFKHKKIIAGIFILFGIWGYAFITGLSASVIRAATMLSFVAVGNMLSRNSNIYNTIAASALFIIIVFGPFKILEVGMQLSYLAVLGIVYFQPKFVALYKPKNKVVKYIWELTCVSVAAQLATAPLALVVFGIFPNLFLISNLIVIPAAFLVLTSGMIYLFVSFWSEPLTLYAGKILAWEFQGLNTAVTGIEQIPYAATYNINFTSTEAVMIYMFLLLVAAGFTLRKKAVIIAGGIVLLTFGTYRIALQVKRASDPQVILYARQNTPDQLILGTEVHSIWGSDQNRKYKPRDTKKQNVDLKSHFIVCDGKVIWRIDEHLTFIPQNVKIHTLLIDSDLPISNLTTLPEAEIETVVVGNKSPYYKRQKLVELFSSINIPIHDTNEKGGYIMPLAVHTHN